MKSPFRGFFFALEIRADELRSGKVGKGENIRDPTETMPVLVGLRFDVIRP